MLLENLILKKKYYCYIVCFLDRQTYTKNNQSGDFIFVAGVTMTIKHKKRVTPQKWLTHKNVQWTFTNHSILPILIQYFIWIKMLTNVLIRCNPIYFNSALFKSTVYINHKLWSIHIR